MLSNDVDRLGDGEAQYTLLTNERGGIVDDLIVYRMAHGHYLLVVNAGNRETAYSWLKEREIHGTEVRDASDESRSWPCKGRPPSSCSGSARHRRSRMRWARSPASR